jgi:hypothetical protein
VSASVSGARSLLGSVSAARSHTTAATSMIVPVSTNAAR